MSITFLASFLPGENVDWNVVVVDEVHSGLGLVQLLQDVQNSGIGGIDIVLVDERQILGQYNVTTNSVAFK